MGHLLQISSRAENSFGVAIMNQMLTFNNQIGGNTATTNTWLGLHDSNDAGLGATEANAAETTNWLYAGTTGGAGPGGQQRIEDTMEAGAVVNFWSNANAAGTGEPNNAVNATNFPDGEDAGELRGDGRWNHLPHKIGPPNNAAATIARRYIIRCARAGDERPGRRLRPQRRDHAIPRVEDRLGPPLRPRAARARDPHGFLPTLPGSPSGSHAGHIYHLGPDAPAPDADGPPELPPHRPQSLSLPRRT